MTAQRYGQYDGGEKHNGNEYDDGDTSEYDGGDTTIIMIMNTAMVI
eukprot:CAMPEP_0172478758 /NCGR_PEP_ID=MMETSP1066-20121228/2923_1 /TAXON_ID=671091 /ORGANISM="Coscinodiscus wailesii, Strain CCMP2513" /LENGTH=45 /DNA_ID= /DNA_START= /DNA_END= /DNA_ORIENTATION=